MDDEEDDDLDEVLNGNWNRDGRSMVGSKGGGANPMTEVVSIAKNKGCIAERQMNDMSISDNCIFGRAPLMYTRIAQEQEDEERNDGVGTFNPISPSPKGSKVQSSRIGIER